MAIPKVFVRSAFNYDRDEVSQETGLVCKDPSLAQQSQAKEADINEIVRQFGLSGRLPEDVRAPVFADFDDVIDYQSAQNAIVRARESFMVMPAAVRARFDNDPQRFVEFCSDRENLVEMRKMGLAVPEEPSPAPAAGVTPPAPGPV